MKIEVTELRLKLYPRNFQKVRAFYESTLGFPVIGEWERGENDHGVMFQVGPTILEVLSPDKEYRPLMGSDISLEVSDVHAIYEQLKNSVPVVFALRSNSWGDISFCITDPEGFEITFFEKV